MGHSFTNGECQNVGCNATQVESWTLVTDVDALKAGDRIVIVSADGQTLLAMSTEQKTSNRGAVAYTLNNAGYPAFGTDVQIIVLEAGTTEGGFAFKVGAQYLYASSSSSNQLKSKNDKDNNGSWKITIDEDGIATIIAQGTSTRNIIRFNPNNGAPLFSCYASTSTTGKLVKIYRLETSVCEHLSKTEITNNPTCTESGSTELVCSTCGKVFEIISTTSPLGHSYGNLIAAKPATCTTAGNIAYYYCATCKSYFDSSKNLVTTVALAATGHNYTNGSCAVCGTKDPNSSSEPTISKATSIAVGDIIYIVCESKDKGGMQLSAISTTTSTKYGIGKSYSDTPADTYALTVVQGYTSGTYAFKTSDGEYLYWTSGNSLATNATLNANTSWKVTFDSSGNAIIKNAKDNTRQLQWNAASTGLRFACYTSGQTAIQIYKKNG